MRFNQAKTQSKRSHSTTDSFLIQLSQQKYFVFKCDIRRPKPLLLRLVAPAEKSSMDERKAATFLLKGNSETNNGVPPDRRADERSRWEWLISLSTAVTVGNYERASMISPPPSGGGEINFKLKQP